VVIVAAGRGERMGAGPDAPPKQLQPILGRPALAWSIEFFERLDAIDAICIVTQPQWRDAARAIAREAQLRCRAASVRSVPAPVGAASGWSVPAPVQTSAAPTPPLSAPAPTPSHPDSAASPKPLYWANGGARRQDSSLAGLRALPPDVDIVAIHDAARPFPPREGVEQAIAAAREHGGALLAIPMTDTVKRADAGGKIIETLDRDRLWLAQTPQVFQRALLARAFEAVEKAGLDLTDDAAALEFIGHAPHLVMGSIENLKITTPADWPRAEDIARSRSQSAFPRLDIC